MYFLFYTFIFVIGIYILLKILLNICLKLDINDVFNRKYNKNAIIDVYLHLIYLDVIKNYKKTGNVYSKLIYNTHSLIDMDNNIYDFSLSIINIFKPFNIVLKIVTLFGFGLFYYLLNLQYFFEDNRLIILAITITFSVIIIYIMHIVLVLPDIQLKRKTIKKFLYRECEFEEIEINKLKKIYISILSKIDLVLNKNSNNDSLQVGINVIIFLLTFVPFFSFLETVSARKFFINNVNINNIFIKNKFNYIILIVFAILLILVCLHLIDLSIENLFYKYRKYDEILLYIKNEIKNNLDNLEEQEVLSNRINDIDIEIEQIKKYKLKSLNKYKLKEEKQIKIYNLEIEKSTLNKKREILNIEFKENINV